MLYISMGIRKKEMTTATHGTAMEAPCVGPQERPKGEWIQDPMTHGVAMSFKNW
jgi:hypothetical protein